MDVDDLSKKYSKIALQTKAQHDVIERKCGRDYILNFLFTYQLKKTENVWSKLSAKITT
jgi:hypothetical protein